MSPREYSCDRTLGDELMGSFRQAVRRAQEEQGLSERQLQYWNVRCSRANYPLVRDNLIGSGHQLIFIMDESCGLRWVRFKPARIDDR